jgi:hypothetical protein
VSSAAGWRSRHMGHVLARHTGHVVLDAAAVTGAARRIEANDHLVYEAALQREKDSKGSAKPLNRCAAFRAEWREGQRGSDADAAWAEKRFRKRLADYRARRHAPPAEWQVPGTRLAEVLAAAAVAGGGPHAGAAKASRTDGAR